MKLKLAISLLAALLFSACASSIVSKPVPHNTFPASDKYKILGRVTIKIDTDESGYLELLKACMDEFPDCDDIVNIMVDFKEGALSDHYIMTAIAVDYPEM